MLALGGLTALGSLATQMFVPALPAAAADLGVPPAAIQQAISVYLIGLGIAQPVWGPLSDSFDRRKVLAASILLFLLGTIAAAAASSLQLLLMARLVQGAGGSGALISCRAIVSTESAEGETAHDLATLTSVTLVSPALAPPAGSLIAAAAGWRSLFLLLSLFAALGLLFILRMPPLPAATRRGPMIFVRGFGRLIRHGGFLAAVAANALIISGFYIFLAASPFILRDEFGLSSGALGLCYTIIAGTMIAGTIALRRFHRPGTARVEWAGIVVTISGALWLGAESAAGLGGPASLILPMALLGFGSGLLAPIVLASALDAEPGLTGSAASLFGSLQMLATAGLSSLATLLLRSSSGSLAAIAATALAGALLLAGRRVVVRGAGA